MKRYVVIRMACLMEDEGQDHVIGSYNSHEAAQARVEEWTENGKGYFKYGDMKIVETEGE